MKKMKKIALYAIALCTLCFIACEEDDKPVINIIDTVGSGAILRTQARVGSTFDRNDSEATFTVSLEEQHDTQGGTIDLTSVDLLLSFADNKDDDVDNNVEEFLLQSFTDFGTSVNGLPTLDFTTTLGESLIAAGLEAGEFDGGDTFSYRFVANLSNGTSWSADDVAGTVSGGSFFSSPFAYNVGVVCIPVEPVTGDYVLNIIDSFGDGWDGAFLTVTIDGVSTDFTITEGSAGSFTVNVPEGTSELIFSYTSGNFEGEHTYEIIAPSGILAAAGGPNPAVGPITLNICT